jgi:hypothetical protein
LEAGGTVADQLRRDQKAADRHDHWVVARHPLAQLREFVSVSAYLTFRRQTSETATGMGCSGTLLLYPVAYSGAVSTGEI